MENIQRRIQNIFKKIQTTIAPVEGNAPGQWVYRGENKKFDTPASSLLYRKYQNIGVDISMPLLLKYVERDRIIKPARKFFPLQATNFEVLNKLKLHGVETNLIDFTTDVHIALFHACRGETTRTGKLILYNRSFLIEAGNILYNNDSSFLLKQTQCGSELTQRTVYAHIPTGFVNDVTHTIDIPGKLKPSMLEYLKTYCGICEETIYVDISGFIAYQSSFQDIEHPFHRGNAYLLQGEYELAIAEFTMVSEQRPDFVEAYYKTGYAQARLGNYTEAISYYTTVITLKPDHHVAYNNRGVAKEKLQDLQGALFDFSKAVELNPDGALAYYNMALTLFESGKKREAVSTMRTARSLFIRTGDIEKKDECNTFLADWELSTQSKSLQTEDGDPLITH